MSRSLLVVMRLADMAKVQEPRQIERACERCGEIVAIYPSGQTVIKAMPNIEIVCTVCKPVPSLGGSRE